MSALLALMALLGAQNTYRVTFNEIGRGGGVQRVLIEAPTQNEARRRAQTIYRARPTSVVLVRRGRR